MEPTVLLGFIAVATTLVMVPGPDWAHVLAAGARDRVVAPAVGGVMIGYVLITAVVAVGLGPLISSVPAAMTALTGAGAAYLVYMGVRSLRAPARMEEPVDTASLPIVTEQRGHVWRGVAVSGLNPKAILIFLSVVPQFVSGSAAWPVTVQLVTLGLLFMLTAGLFYLILGHTAQRLLGSRPGAANVTTKLAGVAMVLLGLTLLAERVVEVAAHGL